jgi:protease I
MRALFLAADRVEDCELLYPLYRLREEGIESDVAAPEATTLTGKHGYTIEANKSFAEVHADDYDLLLLPGGRAPETVRLHDAAVAVTREMLAAGKPVGAVCHGVQILISADGLKGKRATCWKGIRDDARIAGAEYSDEAVVVDGNLITSRMPDDLPAFTRALLQVLRGETVETSDAAVEW